MTFGALNNEIVGNHTEAEWLELCERWNWRCFYCAEPVQRNCADPNHEATKDHVVPISRGGVDFIGNIVLACRHCNDLKGNKTVEEFRSERAWVLSQKSTEDIRCGARPSDPQLIRFVAPSETVDVAKQAPPLPTLEVAAMWKRVVDGVASQKQMQDTRTDHWWQQRRAVLRKQAAGLKRMSLESAGQMTLPIFGDGAARKLMATEPESLTLAGMHVTEPRRKA